jgi:hypothetical protein
MLTETNPHSAVSCAPVIARCCCAWLLMTSAITGYAGPVVGQGNAPVSTEWASGSSQVSRPDQSMSFAPALESSPTLSLHAMPQQPPAPPMTYTPMYKCPSADRTTYQDTPCDKGVLYHNKGTAIKPEY